MVCSGCYINVSVVYIHKAIVNVAIIWLGNGRNLMHVDSLLWNSKHTHRVISAKKIGGSCVVRAHKKIP